MKRLMILPLLLLATSMCFGQYMAGYTEFATVLPDFQGVPLQYSFPVSPFSAWTPNWHASKFKFNAGPNVAQVQTVKGVTELWLIDNHDLCGHPKTPPAGYCSFLGVLQTPLSIVSEPVGQGTSQHVSGVFVGTFTGPFGDVYEGVQAYLTFDTAPTVDQVQWPLTGGVTIVLQYN